MDEVAQVAFWVVVGTVAVTVSIFAFWRIRSAFQIWRADEWALHSVREVIWRDPGEVETLDLEAGPGGRDGMPSPPYTFVEEHFGGSQPCVSVRDRRGRTWRVKWGDEVQVETLATRLAWAAGYFVETTFYVPDGRILGAGTLQRAVSCLGPDGTFAAARFELDEDNVIKHFDEQSWAWNDNPFVGTRELNGLKIVMMWLSNWDAKDLRDVARGSNTAIFEYPIESSGRGRRRMREARYLIIDWGGALGRWGSVVRRGRWDCEGMAAESDGLVLGVDGDLVRFGYTGQRTADMVEGIRVDDVRWLMQKLGRLTDAQIAGAVKASGGTPDEMACFTSALRRRLDHLAAVSTANSAASAQPLTGPSHQTAS